MLPLISVIIPTYKRALFLPRAIDSVLQQTYPKVEIIVVDDNNPNTEFRLETERVMESYSDKSNVRYIRHLRNYNGATARNTGIKNSFGIYICFLDDDDWYMPDKLEKQYQYLLQHPQYCAVYCGWERDGKIVHPFKEGDLSFELLSGTDIIYTNTIMVAREKAMECNGWDERFKRNQEAVFLLRFFSKGGTIGVVPEVLVKFDTSDRSNQSVPIQFEEDFTMLLELHQREIDRCTARFPEARQIIYSYRYRGVLLNYIKHGCLFRAFSLYRRMSRQIPKRFRHDCLLYVKRKFTGVDLFYEFNKEKQST